MDTDKSLSSQKEFGNAKNNNWILNSSNSPLSLSYSCPSSVSVYYPQPQAHQQPPLLPLPSTKQNRGVSCPPINRKIENKTSPKKSNATISAKRADPKCLMLPSANSMGPDPNNFLKDVSGVLSSSAVFTMSPPPSSLPLPSFSLRPKLSCNAQAALIDAGATDNLRRLLRIR